MTMKFITVKKALIGILGNNADGQFRVIGFQRQSKNSREVRDTNRFVQVYYKEGGFPKSGGGLRMSKKHDTIYNIEFTASKAATVDLATLNNESSTASQKIIALAGLKEAADLADDSFDELVDIVYQILMDAQNLDLGLSVGNISNRWISRVVKDTIIEQGDLVTITGNMNFECSVSEGVTGVTPTAGQKTFNNTIDIDGDDVEKTGVTVLSS